MSVQDIRTLQHAAGNRAVRQLILATTGARRPEDPRWRGPNGLFVGENIQRFSAGPHEEMSAAALRGHGYSREQLADIQMGNWATDMNQISLIVPYLQRYLGFTLSSSEQSQIVQLLAVGHFGEATAARMNRAGLGEYTASEHFDNPASATSEPEQRAVASHITPGAGRPAGETGIGNIELNLGRALRAGRTSIGLQHYGRAVHTTEDFFAHTNFVRIAVRLIDPAQPEPYGGRVERGPDAGRYRLTSGIFEPADTALSILHLLIGEVMKEPEPGRITSGDRIILMIVNHASPTLGAAFQAYLSARTVAARAASAVATAIGVAVPAVGVYNQARELARRGLEAALNAATAEAGRRVTGTGSQPSHTRMNVDDPASGGRLYPIARDLATHVVSELDPLMQAAWRAPAGADREAARRVLFARLRSLLVHPQDSDWWRSIVTRHPGRR